jgi:hypothetical protein
LHLESIVHWNICCKYCTTREVPNANEVYLPLLLS